MRRIYNTFIILFSILCLSCIANNKNNIEEENLPINNDFYFSKIDSLVNIYNREEYLTFYNKKQTYPVEDSLSLYLSKLDKKKLYNNSNLKWIMGKLLEKKYLEVRNSGMFPPESFPVYNMSLVSYNEESSRFALNFILNGKVGEFSCIDSVVLVLDKLPQMKNDSNHQKCMYLVRNNMTGGCKW